MNTDWFERFTAPTKATPSNVFGLCRHCREEITIDDEFGDTFVHTETQQITCGLER